MTLTWAGLGSSAGVGLLSVAGIFHRSQCVGLSVQSPAHRQGGFKISSTAEQTPRRSAVWTRSISRNPGHSLPHRSSRSVQRSTPVNLTIKPRLSVCNSQSCIQPSQCWITTEFPTHRFSHFPQPTTPQLPAPDHQPALPKPGQARPSPPYRNGPSSGTHHASLITEPTAC